MKRRCNYTTRKGHRCKRAIHKWSKWAVCWQHARTAKHLDVELTRFTLAYYNPQYVSEKIWPGVD